MINKLTTDLNHIQALDDEPNDVTGLTPTQLKAIFDQAPNDIKTYINSLVDILNSTTDGASGADNIGATAITDLDGATVQAILESIRNKLKSVTDGSSGADFINATSIDGLTGSTVQTLIKSLKTYSESYTYKKSETDSKLQGIVLGQIPSNSLTEDTMANDMKKDVVGGVTSFDTFATEKAEIATVDPTITDDTSKGYLIGKHWINTSTGEEWVCVDNTLNNAIWRSIQYNKTIAKTYGVKIDTTNSNPATALTYINEAIGFTPASGNNGAFNYGSWADKFPFNQIKPCLYKNGVVNYYLNPNDYTKKVDGSASDITTGNDGDVMVEFPKIYWKFETIGTDLYIRYADRKLDDGYKCLAHMRGTTEKDKCYISAYLGYSLSSKLRSLSGKTPTASQTIGTFRTQAQANGANYDQMAYYQLLMLQVLFIIMFKNRDSKTALGKGYTDGSNSASIVTGGTDKKGMFYGENTGKLQNKFCGIEDFWGNLYYWIDGFFSDANWHMLINNQNFNDTGNGYSDYGQGATANLGGYISTIQGTTETGFTAKATAGSTTTYYCDFGYLYASFLPDFGGNWSSDAATGAFYLNVVFGAADAHANIGGRLMIL